MPPSGNGPKQPRHLHYKLTRADSAPANLMRERQMLSTIALILIVLWLLGMVSSYTMGGFIHILLVVAVVVFLVRVIQGRRPVV
jgi:hypothetical protein